MKTAKKVLSLMMSIVMCFTSSSALYAGDFDINLDELHLKELKNEFHQEINNKSHDDITEIIDRWEHAKKKYKAWSKEIKRIKMEGTEKKVVEEYIGQLEKTKEEHLEQNKERYSKFSKKERDRIAFATVFFLSYNDLRKDFLEAAELPAIGISGIISAIGCVMMFVGAFGKSIPSWVVNVGLKIFRGGGIGVLASILISLISKSSYAPVLSLSMSAEETCEVFSERPFEILSKFRREIDYQNLYYKCPGLLEGAVGVFHMVSENPNPENLEEMSYVGTIYWHEMTWREREAHFADSLEILKSRNKTTKFSKRIGLVEK